VRGGVISKSTGAICAKGGVKTPRLTPVCRKRMAKRKSYNSYYVKTLVSHCFITLLFVTELCATRKPQDVVSLPRCSASAD